MTKGFDNNWVPAEDLNHCVLQEEEDSNNIILKLYLVKTVVTLNLRFCLSLFKLQHLAPSIMTSLICRNNFFFIGIFALAKLILLHLKKYYSALCNVQTFEGSFEHQASFSSCSSKLAKSHSAVLSFQYLFVNSICGICRQNIWSREFPQSF